MEDVNDQTCMQYWIHWRPWLRYTVQGIQHCHFVSQNAVMLSSLAIFFKRSDQWWCLLAAIAPWSVGCIVVVTLGGKIFTVIRGCLKLVHSHLDEKGALYVGKTAFCSNPHCFSKARNSGGGKCLEDQFSKSRIHSCWFLFVFIDRNGIYFVTCGHLWFFFFCFSNHWKSRVSTTHDCKVSFRYLLPGRTLCCFTHEGSCWYAFPV